MLELPWLHLLEAVRPDSISMRVLLHDLPKREGKCLAELHVSILEGAVCEPAKLLDTKVPLSPRQTAVVQIFTQATAFSAKRNVYALSPTQAMTLLAMANDITLEIKKRGVATMASEPAVLGTRLLNEEIIFQAMDSKSNPIEEPMVLGVERAWLIDKNFKIFNLEPVFLPKEAEKILESAPLPVSCLADSEPQEVYSQLAKMGVDLSSLRAIAKKPDSSQLILRALLARNGELRLHLVNNLTLGDQEDEVEVYSKGALEPVFWLPDSNAVYRPTELEERARDYLFSLGAVPAEKHRGFSAKGQKALNLISYVSKKENLPDWLAIDEDCLPNLKYLPLKPVLAVEPGEDDKLKVQIQIDGLRFSLDKLFEMAAQDTRALLLDDDTVLSYSPQAVSALKTLAESLDIKELSDIKQYSFSEVALLLKMLSNEVDLEAEAALAKRLTGFIPGPIEEDHWLPSSLKTSLRPYQHDALVWMSQMHRAGLGRLLADEMGLGKTIMVLSLIALIKEREGLKPNLVVAPTSVLDVWVEESARHFEGLKVIKWHGADRGLQRQEAEKADLVVTSYALLRRDIKELSQMPFRYLIIDEAQTIKNSKTESWKAARVLKAEQRMALSGTPIENRISDLFSILELVAPGILGDERSFIRRYGMAERNAELRERVKPLILRRKKEDVESDLPPKIENVLHCEMKEEQRAVYLDILRLAKQELTHTTQNSIPLLAALTRLRQVCCDPALVPGAPKGVHSAKLELFLNIMEERLAAGRKVIVYSQFVKMQKILIDSLKDRGLGNSLWLHGGTTDRAQVVSRFQDPKGPPIIIVSLKAGGTGITLTAADTVVYYDPWWNPAVMDQAADRAHRIGQTKTVHLIKLVCQNSIEEQILTLCEHKRALATDVLLSDQGGARSLTLEDIRQLLQVEIDREV
ncbi:MAG: DEAD/DEAH box helicase [Deltaproteobacteria bacterium]|nr:DEAD/DEAH box helicase [Deltaproteobacteria bacterium]